MDSLSLFCSPRRFHQCDINLSICVREVSIGQARHLVTIVRLMKLPIILLDQDQKTGEVEKLFQDGCELVVLVTRDPEISTVDIRFYRVVGICKSQGIFGISLCQCL